jgi:putative sterol carrier protein
MPLTFPSPEWVAEFEKQINASPEYQASSLTWEAGPLALVAEADPDIGLDEDVAIWLDLLHGECREAKLVSIEEGEKAPFVLRGTYELWKRILRKEIGPVKALLQGKLKLQGSMVTIMRYVKGAQELVECATKVPTQFLDE